MNCIIHDIIFFLVVVVYITIIIKIKKCRLGNSHAVFRSYKYALPTPDRLTSLARGSRWACPDTFSVRRRSTAARRPKPVPARVRTATVCLTCKRHSRRRRRCQHAVDDSVARADHAVPPNRVHRVRSSRRRDHLANVIRYVRSTKVVGYLPPPQLYK